MNIPGFTEEALSAVHELLFGESIDKRLGVCGARSKNKIGRKTLTPAQNAAARARVGKTTSESSGLRSEAAKRAAQTRKKCKSSTSVV